MTPERAVAHAAAHARMMAEHSNNDSINAAINSMVEGLAAGPRHKNCEVLIALVTIIAAHLEELPVDQRRVAAAAVSMLLAEALEVL